MKLSRLAAAGTGLALVAASTLVGAAAAHAADVPVTLPSPLPAEAGPYPAGWFAGTVSGATGSAVQTAAGVVITGGANGFQLLNGTPASGPAGTLAAATGATAVSSVGSAFYQVSVFGEPGAADQEFTTLRPVDPAAPGGDWTTSRAITGYAANAVASRTDLVSALDAGLPAQVLAFGVFVNAGDTVTLRALEFGGDTYWFTSARPTASAPASVTVADLSKPITLSASGFQPGESVIFGYGFGSSGDTLPPATANAAGTATVTLSLPTNLPAGSVLLFGAQDLSGLFAAYGQVSIVANVLPATGLDASAPLAIGGILLLAGAGLALVALRRKGEAAI